VTLRSEDRRTSVRISVQDDGRGMTEEEQAHAFDPFYSRRGGYEGTGLGLTLCHGIVSDHDGTIAVDSQPGRGTLVTIDLPVGRG
jgi:signal transduction histidine kinase